MTKNKINKKLLDLEDKLNIAIDNLQSFLDETEDEEISSMGHELCEGLLDFLYENDKCSIDDIKTHIEETFE